MKHTLTLDEALAYHRKVFPMVGATIEPYIQRFPNAKNGEPKTKKRNRIEVYFEGNERDTRKNPRTGKVEQQPVVIESNNCADTLLKLAQKAGNMRVFYDEHENPTCFLPDFASI